MKKLEQFSEFLDDDESSNKDSSNNVEHLKEAKKNLEKEDIPWNLLRMFKVKKTTCLMTSILLRVSVEFQWSLST